MFFNFFIFSLFFIVLCGAPKMDNNTAFLKNLIVFIKINFFVFLDYFNVLMSKIIFFFK